MLTSTRKLATNISRNALISSSARAFGTVLQNARIPQHTPERRLNTTDLGSERSTQNVFSQVLHGYSLLHDHAVHSACVRRFSTTNSLSFFWRRKPDPEREKLLEQLRERMKNEQIDVSKLPPPPKSPIPMVFAETISMQFPDGGVLFLVAANPFSKRIKSNIRMLIRSQKPHVVFADISKYEWSIFSKETLREPDGSKQKPTARFAVVEGDIHPRDEVVNQQNEEGHENKTKVFVPKVVRGGPAAESPKLFEAVFEGEADSSELYRKAFIKYLPGARLDFEVLSHNEVEEIRKTAASGLKNNWWNYWRLTRELKKLNKEGREPSYGSIESNESSSSSSSSSEKESSNRSRILTDDKWINDYLSYNLNTLKQYGLGEEYRVAFDEAKRVGADFVLMDRDFKETLQRALKKLRPKQLARTLLLPLMKSKSSYITSGAKIDKEDEYMDQHKNDHISLLVMSPKIYEFCVTERAYFMSSVINKFKKMKDKYLHKIKSPEEIDRENAMTIANYLGYNSPSEVPSDLKLDRITENHIALIRNRGKFVGVAIVNFMDMLPLQNAFYKPPQEVAAPIPTPAEPTTAESSSSSSNIGGAAETQHHQQQ